MPCLIVNLKSRTLPIVSFSPCTTKKQTKKNMSQTLIQQYLSQLASLKSASNLFLENRPANYTKNNQLPNVREGGKCRGAGHYGNNERRRMVA
jgi:hypothetical protein